METPTPDLSTPEWDKIFKPLLFDLGRQKCVLLLGPELARTGGRLMREALREQLVQNHSDDIACVHERAYPGGVEIALPHLQPMTTT